MRSRKIICICRLPNYRYAREQRLIDAPASAHARQLRMARLRVRKRSSGTSITFGRLIRSRSMCLYIHTYIHITYLRSWDRVVERFSRGNRLVWRFVLLFLKQMQRYLRVKKRDTLVSEISEIGQLLLTLFLLSLKRESIKSYLIRFENRILQIWFNK